MDEGPQSPSLIAEFHQFVDNDDISESEEPVVEQLVADVHIPPQSPSHGGFRRFNNHETKEERAARLAHERRIDDLMWMDIAIGDTLVMDDRPAETNAEQVLLASQPPGVQPEDNTTAANTLRDDRQNQLQNLQYIANRTSTYYNHSFSSHSRVNECKYQYSFKTFLILFFKKTQNNILIIVIRSRDRLHREIRASLPDLAGLSALYHKIAHNPQAIIQRWFRDQSEDENSPLYTDTDLGDLISRVLESFSSSTEP